MWARKERFRLFWQKCYENYLATESLYLLTAENLVNIFFYPICTRTDTNLKQWINAGWDPTFVPFYYTGICYPVNSYHVAWYGTGHAREYRIQSVLQHASLHLWCFIKPSNKSLNKYKKQSSRYYITWKIKVQHFFPILSFFKISFFLNCIL